MKNHSTPYLFARVACWAATFFVSLTAAHAQHFTGYDEIVPAGAPGTITVVNGAGKVLPANRSYVIGIDGGTRGCIEFRNWTGTAEYPIVVTNRHDAGRVTITDYTGSTTTPTFNGVTIEHCRYFQLRGDNNPGLRYGIEIGPVGRTAGRRGIELLGMSSYVEAMFLEIHHATFAGIMAKQDPQCNTSATSGEWSWHPNLVWNDIKFHDNYIHDVGGEGFYIGFTAWDKAQCSSTAWGHEIHGLKVYNNLVERGGWDGIQVGAARTGTEIYNNVVVDSGTDTAIDPATGKLPPGNTGAGVQIGAGTSGLFYNNTVINSRGNNLALFGVGDNYVFNNFFIEGGNTMFADNRPNPIPAGQRADRQTQADAPYYIFNNTAINPRGQGFWTMNEVSANYFKNNIIIVPQGPNEVRDYIRYDATVTPPPGGEVGNITQRDFTGLNFANAAGYDFRITSASVARDAGVTLSAVARDFQGIPRPQGASYDAGASEVGALSTYLIASPPTVGSNNGSLNASTIGGTPPYTYAWAHGPTTAVVNNLSPGLYSVTVTDAAGANFTQATYLFAGAEMGMPVTVPLPNQVAAPTMNPPSGTYSSARSVTLSTSTAGASIRYTTNGTMPTSTSGTVYSAPIPMSAPGTIKAIAYKPGMLDSTVTVATYFIGTPPATPSGMHASASDRRAKVTWNSVANANRYDVKRGTSSSGPFTLLTSVTTTSYTDNAVSNGTTYYYVVSASNIFGTSANSAVVSATPAPYPATIEILKPLAWGQATGSAYCPATGAFNEPPTTWDMATQRPAGHAAGIGASTLTGYANRFWYVDFGPDFATWHITEMWTRYRIKSAGSHPGFGGFWWDDDIDTVNDNGVADTDLNFANGQNVPYNDTERLYARDRDFGAFPKTPSRRYLIVSVGPSPTDKPDEFIFVGYRSNAPAITTQPQSQNVATGENVTFSVAASGAPAPTYQWRKNGVNISGATSASYTITNVQTSHAGDYTVAVSNSGGSVTSAVASLVVSAIEIITPVAWGQSGPDFCAATGAFNEQPTGWDGAQGKPQGISATPHGSTVTAYVNRYWYIDFGVNYAKVRITQMWTRYRPNSPGSFTGFGGMWWDNDNDTTNDDGVAAPGMNFGTAQNQANLSSQVWVRDALFTTPVTPQRRYLMIATGPTPSDRPNEFAFIGYRVP